MDNLLTPILTLTGLGIIFGAGLALAAKKFCVVTDLRLEKIYAQLPGTNCGACGKPGCIGFAEGLIKGTCSIEGCVVAEEKVREMIAGVLGVEHKDKLKKVAVLHCNGGNKRAGDKFEYSGIRSCLSANLIAGGPKACIYGCIGYGDCQRVCLFGAITMNEEGLPVVDEYKCTACGKCVAVCPKKLFSLTSADKKYSVRCRSLDLGKKVMQVCSVGCIACRKCEKACPVEAIKMIDNLSVIDYNICDNRGECFRVCPTKSIARKEDKLWKMHL
ncbi:MAG: RnfABCDGE type electron transport complex subunit B [Candidatus Omnitrophica bacterium]|nr:RnfABCDGE type electron transport complex subunit B [Candidatus Omnitrophota bacterium]